MIENYPLKNLETNNKNSNYYNVGGTKSLIFAQYNSYIEESKDNKNDKKYIYEEEIIYKELKTLNNNNDFDNGVINTQKEEDIKNHNDKIEKMKNVKW